MDDVVLAKLYALNAHPLVFVFNSCTPAWKTIFHMLRPMDIVSLARATIF
jgi:hypothetical protein